MDWTGESSNGPADTDAPEQGAAPLPPSAWRVLWIWSALGLQSFGGGAATLYLIRRAVVDQQRWLSADEFTRSWAVCQIAPGINLLGLTILVGWHVGRVRGVLLALAGLLIPSVVLTILLTALYAQIQALGWVQAGMNGLIPATVGLGLLLAAQMARPLLRESQREGRLSLALSVALLLGSAALAAFTTISVLWLIWGAGLIGAVLSWRRAVDAGRRRGV